ncbi:MAG: hypothetical protein IKU08_02935 [Clostridia bacterium]|nr:hypothetical protein [Clostridia bacterium]
MKTELHYYDIFPKVFPAGKEVTITIKPLGYHADFENPDKISLHIYGLDDGNPRDYPHRGNGYELPFEFDGCIKFTHTFPREQQYYVRIMDRDSGKRLLQLSVYALDEDLCGRYPLIGDLHMHTCRSDGKQCPAIVCANYRKHGYDFFAITDHNRYYPSLEAIETYKDVPIEFNICPGEEVHLPDLAPDHINDIHIVNFGGKYSVNAILLDEHTEEIGGDIDKRRINGFPAPAQLTEDEYRAEVDALAATLDIPEGIEPFTYASCVWVFNHIKKAEGLGIFCHPYWLSNVHQVPENITNYMLKSIPFDAFEVLGGENYYEHNGFQTHKYYEIKAQGYNFPIVGSTDSHSSVNNRNAFICSTMVFSPANECEAIIDSIKKYYSIAIDTISTEFRLVGDFRLARYATFLLQDYFPLHDDLCYEEGRAMKDYACGIEGAKETLEFISGRIKKQREKYFAF